MDARTDELKREGLEAQMLTLGRRAREAARTLATAPSAQKNDALRAMSRNLYGTLPIILDANKLDVEAAKRSGMAASFVDRLTLDRDRVNAIGQGLEAIAGLDDPIGAKIAAWDRPNGLNIERVRTPLGVVGVIYESRPNVTADAGALCLKAGNAVILRGGSDSLNSAQAIHSALEMGLRDAGLPNDAIQLVPVRDREAVGMMLTGLDGAIDVIVPRGGRSLVERVQNEARVPVFAHLEGICHIYVDEAADLDMAVDVIENAKMRRTGICGAAECVLIHEAVAETHAPAIVARLQERGCEVRGDDAIAQRASGVVPASEADWGKEFLDTIIAMKIVHDMDEAMNHIAFYGSSHTEAIITEDAAAAERFLKTVDSAIVMHNASTQFADGGEFGMGAEIGIATGRMHARGPVGVEQLTSFRYVVRGSGQTRP
ncbi:MAG: glutamate-5-semialdehyde dehydrogenase [Pseudomonadota bacterium]